MLERMATLPVITRSSGSDLTLEIKLASLVHPLLPFLVLGLDHTRVLITNARLDVRTGRFSYLASILDQDFQYVQIATVGSQVQGCVHPDKQDT